MLARAVAGACITLDDGAEPLKADGQAKTQS
jgi:hypothetical protein